MAESEAAKMMYIPVLDDLKQSRGTYQAQLNPKPEVRLYWLCDLLFNGHMRLTSWSAIWRANYNRQYEAERIAELNREIERFNGG
jgi:hypothetical protein